MIDKQLCDGCDKCCKHIAMEIDKPTCQLDYNNIAWYLMHENVKVFVCHDNEWHLEFSTRCKALGKDKLCKIYEDRPSICRGYTQDSCVKDSEAEAEKISFTSREEFLNYLKKKKIDYNPTGKRRKRK